MSDLDLALLRPENAIVTSRATARAGRKATPGKDGIYHRKGRGWYAVVEFPRKSGKRDRRWYGPFDARDEAKAERDKRRNDKQAWARKRETR